MNPSTENNLEHHSTGVPLFDRQNRELLEAISRLESEVTAGRIDIDHAFRKGICRLMRTLKNAFREQEQWMQDTGFCGCAILNQSHRYFLREIEHASCELENSRDRACELIGFLKERLICYIRTMNDGLRFHAQSRGLTEPCRNLFEITPSEFMAPAKSL